MKKTRKTMAKTGLMRRVRAVKMVYGKPDAENPEWTADMIAQAKRGKYADAGLAKAAAQLRARGRPTIGAQKMKQISIRVDPETLAALKGTGKGLQETIREALTREANRIRSHERKRA
jgi:uncharacterized protein (DUF4415 family)